MSRYGKVLLADDSPHAQRMGERILREEGYEVVTVTDGETAILRFKDIQPDVVIVDTFLPQVSGYDLCGFIKKQPQYSHVRVILTSTALERVDEDQAFHVGADGQLKKPFEASVMLKSLKDFISGSEKDGKKRRSGLGLDLSTPAASEPSNKAQNDEPATSASRSTNASRATGDKTAIQAWLDKQDNAADAANEAPDPLGLSQTSDTDTKKPETKAAESVSLANPQLLRNAGDEPEDLSLRNNPVAKLRNVPAATPKSDPAEFLKNAGFGGEPTKAGMAILAALEDEEIQDEQPSSDAADAPKARRSLLDALAEYESASELAEVARQIRQEDAANSVVAGDLPVEAAHHVAPATPAAEPPLAESVPEAVSSTAASEAANTPSVELSLPVPPVALAQSGVRLDAEEIRAAVEIAVSAALPSIVAEVSRCLTLALESRYRTAQEKQSGRASG